MKYRLFLSVLLLVFLLGCLSCFSINGNKNVISSLLQDDAGNIFVVYRVERSAGDHDIHLQWMDTDINTVIDSLLFAGDNRRVNVLDAVSDGDNSVFVALEVLTPENGKDGPHRFERTIILKVDKQGNIKSHQDLSIQGIKILSDGNGGVILGWVTKDKCTIERKDGDSNTVWTYAFTDRGADLQMAAGDNGESFILWKDLDNPYSIVQKLDSSGHPVWGEPGISEGVPLKSLETSVTPEFHIISDGSGGAIMSWAEMTNDGPSGSVWVCRIGADGKVYGDKPVRELASPVNVYTRVTADNPGGGIVVWEDLREGMALYAQKVNSVSLPIWQENGVAVCTGLPEVSPRFNAIDNGEGGAVVFWIDGSYTLNAQMLNSAGQKQWGYEGIRIAKGVCDLPITITGDKQYGFVVGWSTGKDAYSPENSHVQKINAEGNLLWGKNGIELPVKSN
jgi:hypothetical protein